LTDVSEVCAASIRDDANLKLSFGILDSKVIKKKDSLIVT
jgi:hypothetical protein